MRGGAGVELHKWRLRRHRPCTTKLIIWHPNILVFHLYAGYTLTAYLLVHINGRDPRANAAPTTQCIYNRPANLNVSECNLSRWSDWRYAFNLSISGQFTFRIYDSPNKPAITAG